MIAGGADEFLIVYDRLGVILGSHNGKKGATTLCHASRRRLYIVARSFVPTMHSRPSHLGGALFTRIF